MKVGLDQYSYHRYFGEIYPQIEQDPGSRMTLAEFVDTAHGLGVDGVSLESCFLPNPTSLDVAQLRAHLDRLGLERVWEWGHPGGLQSGAAPHQLKDLMRHTEIARDIGAKVMRICCGGRRTRPADWAAHKAALIPLLREATQHASQQGVVLAIENHIDLLADELVELIQAIDSPWLGVCLDTANNLRMLEDPALVIEKLAPYARATHVKDVTAHRGNPNQFAFWPSVPLGRGLIDFPRAFEALRRNAYQGLLALEIDYLHPGYASDSQAVSDSLIYMRSIL